VVIDRLVAIRDNALKNGDRNLWLEAQHELKRLGYVETEAAVPPAIDVVVPTKRGPGRPRKMRE
jgi:hypothetical protein